MPVLYFPGEYSPAPRQHLPAAPQLRQSPLPELSVLPTRVSPAFPHGDISFRLCPAIAPKAWGAPLCPPTMSRTKCPRAPQTFSTAPGCTPDDGRGPLSPSPTSGSGGDSSPAGWEPVLPRCPASRGASPVTRVPPGSSLGQPQVNFLVLGGTFP